MARPNGEGFPYYPMECFIAQDKKIKGLMRKHGPQALAIYAELLAMVYRDKGFYLEITENTFEDLADTLYIRDLQEVITIVSEMLKVGLFDERLYATQRILTSAGIQKRFLKMAQRRKSNIIPANLLLHTETKVIVDNNPSYCIQEPGLLHTEKNATRDELLQTKVAETPVIVDRNHGYCIQKPQLLHTQTSRVLKVNKKAKAFNPPYNPPLVDETTQTEIQTEEGGGGRCRDDENSPESQTEPKNQGNPSVKASSDGKLVLRRPGRPQKPTDTHPSKIYQESPTSDSRADFGDSGAYSQNEEIGNPENDPVYQVIAVWNDVFQGTPYMWRALYPTPIMAHNITKQLKLDSDLETYRSVFQYARAEAEGKGIDNHQFIWTLDAVFNKSTNFNRLLAKANTKASQKPVTQNLKGAPVASREDYIKHAFN